MKKEPTTIKHETAPSGFVTFYDYKEPFTKFKEGFGYIGVLLHDTESGKIQCHFCGEWLTALPAHLHYKHDIKSRAYKEKVGLLHTTALISEKTRESMINKDHTNALRALTFAREKNARNRTKINRKYSTTSAEFKNKNGTCPEQLLQRIRDKAKELGRTPTNVEVKGVKTILATYGTWNNATKLAGLKVRKMGVNVNHAQVGEGERHTDEYYLEMIRTFYATHGRLPGWSDVKRKMFPSTSMFARRFGSWPNAIKKALPRLRPQTHSQRIRAYQKWARTHPLSVK